MRRRPRTKYTETHEALMWERWKKGVILHRIARLLDLPHTSIWQILAESGGIRPPERPGRSRAAKAYLSRRRKPCRTPAKMFDECVALTG